MLSQRGNLLANQQPVLVDAHANQAHAAVCKFQHLQRARVEDELFDIVADELLRADAHVNRQRILNEQLFLVHVFSRTNACNFRRGMKKRVRDLAGHHVGFIGVGQRDDDIGVSRAGARQYFGVGGMPDDGTNIEAVLEFPQDFGAHVDDGDFVRLFARKMVCC